MNDTELKIEPLVTLSARGKKLTTRQLEVLRMIYEEGSQNRAAAKLRISLPVLHRYLLQIESKIGLSIRTSSHMGTKLNHDGERIALEYIALNRRLSVGRGITVGGTPVTEELLQSSLSRMDPGSRIGLIISDDERNLQDFQAGMMDMVILDDPLNAFELDNVSLEVIAKDRLLNVDHGERYGRFAYGAQRLGFRELERSNATYRIERSYRSINALASSGLSFFVNESLAMRKGLKLRSDMDPNRLSHEIYAAFRSEKVPVRRLVLEMQKESRHEYYLFR